MVPRGSRGRSCLFADPLQGCGRRVLRAHRAELPRVGITFQKASSVCAFLMPKSRKNMPATSGKRFPTKARKWLPQYWASCFAYCFLVSGMTEKSWLSKRCLRYLRWLFNLFSGVFVLGLLPGVPSKSMLKSSSERYLWPGGDGMLRSDFSTQVFQKSSGTLHIARGRSVLKKHISARFCTDRW